MEILATGLHVPEGPAVRDDGSVLFTEQTAGRVSVLGADGVEEFAYVGGAPNSCAVGASGEVYVCQNGGVVGAWRSADLRTPSIQVVTADGVHTLSTSNRGRDLIAPNDLAFHPNGRLYFTDPAQPFDPDHREPRRAIYALGADAEELVIDVGGVYCNGVGFGARGELIWVESYTRRVMTLTEDNRARELCRLPAGEIPDGFAVAEDGRIFIASCGSHGISVVSPDGDYLGLMRLDDTANPTNCCFLGDDLVVTDFGTDFERNPTAGRLWRVPVGVRGARVTLGSIS